MGILKLEGGLTHTGVPNCILETLVEAGFTIVLWARLTHLYTSPEDGAELIEISSRSFSHMQRGD